MRSGWSWLLVVFGCGGASTPCPRDTIAMAYMRTARDHGMMAERHVGASTAQPHRWDRPYTGDTWYPWFYYWEPELEHRRLVAANVSPTDARERVHRSACAGIPAGAQARSLLDTYALDSARLGNAVMVHISKDAGPPEALLVGMRCHRAWLQLGPREIETQDMLAIDGVNIVVSAGVRDGIDVMFWTDDPRMLGEIELRARISVIRAKRLRE